MCWFFCFLITRNNIESFGSNCILHKRTVEIHRWQVWTVWTQTKLLRDTLTEYMRTQHTWTQTTRSAHTVQRLVNDLRATDANIQLMCMFVVSCVLVHIYAHLWAHAVYTHTRNVCERNRWVPRGREPAMARHSAVFEHNSYYGLLPGLLMSRSELYATTETELDCPNMAIHWFVERTGDCDTLWTERRMDGYSITFV